MVGYIYKTTNLINGKIYIGQHQSQVFEPEKYIGSGKILTEAINKFGIKNFKNELICWCETIEELNQQEIYWIAKYNATDATIGYNISGGGSGVTMTKSIKSQISQTLVDRHLHCYNNGVCNKYFGDNDIIPDGFKLGRILINVSDETWKHNASVASKNAVHSARTDATKEKIRAGHLGEKVYNNGTIEIRLKDNEEIPQGFIAGLLMTKSRKAALEKWHEGAARGNEKRKLMSKDELKEKFGKHNIGKTPRNAKKVVCIETNKLFNSIKDVMIFCNCSQYKVQTAISKNLELCGYHWKYFL